MMSNYKRCIKIVDDYLSINGCVTYSIISALLRGVIPREIMNKWKPPSLTKWVRTCTTELYRRTRLKTPKCATEIVDGRRVYRTVNMPVCAANGDDAGAVGV